MKKPAPAKPALRQDKYFLRDIHQEIDLYDRKLAYLDKHEEFATPEDRSEAEKKLVTKRANLEKTALELARSGVAYEAKDLPRSFRAKHPEPSEQPSATETVSDKDELK